MCRRGLEDDHPLRLGLLCGLCVMGPPDVPVCGWGVCGGEGALSVSVIPEEWDRVSAEDEAE